MISQGTEFWLLLKTVRVHLLCRNGKDLDFISIPILCLVCRIALTWNPRISLKSTTIRFWNPMGLARISMDSINNWIQFHSKSYKPNITNIPNPSKSQSLRFLILLWNSTPSKPFSLNQTPLRKTFTSTSMTWSFELNYPTSQFSPHLTVNGSQVLGLKSFITWQYQTLTET